MCVCVCVCVCEGRPRRRREVIVLYIEGKHHQYIFVPVTSMTEYRLVNNSQLWNMLQLY